MRDAVPLADPARDIAAYREEILAAFTRVVERGPYILGEEVAAFEAQIARSIGVEHAIGAASGTDALVLGLLGLGVGAGDEVITVSHTAGPTVAAIRMIGAVPVLIEVDPETYCLDPTKIEAAASEKTKAIIVVHLYGRPARMDVIASEAQRLGLKVLEDCAQAQGAELHGKPIGSWGHSAAFSFYPTKILGALGDGGLVATNDPATAERITRLRTYGWSAPQYSTIPLGRCSRLDPLQAAALRVRLPRLPQEIEQRRELAERYSRAFTGSALILPAEAADERSVFHLYVVRTTERDGLMAHLQERHIGAGVHYPYPVHKQPGLSAGARVPVDLSATERLSGEILTLPLFPSLTEQEQNRVITAVLEFIG